MRFFRPIGANFMRHGLSVLILISTVCGMAFAEEQKHFQRMSDKEQARQFRLISDNVPTLEVLIPRPDLGNVDKTHPRGSGHYSVAQRLESLLPKLDRKFFSGTFKKSYAKAYEVALEEEHNVLPMQLISDQMRELARPSLWGRSVETWERLLDLDKRFRKMDALEQQKVLFAWREPFREKLQEYVSYRSSLKPWLSATLISNTASDSNVNRTPDGVNDPYKSGQRGGSQTFVLSINVKPLINYKKLPKDIKWSNAITLVKQNQFVHQENDLGTAGIEPKVTKTLQGPISSVSLAYKYNHLLLKPGSFNSRDVSSFAHSHRLKLDVGSRPYALDWGVIRQGKGSVFLSQEWKTPFDPATGSQDGTDTKLGLSHKMKLSKGSLKGAIDVALELSDFETAASPSSDSQYWKLTLKNDLKYKWGFWKHPIEFNEKLEMRTKNWDQRTGGAFEEQLYTVALKVGTRVSPKLKTSLEAKQNWRETSQDNPAVADSSAQQTQITFNLTWKIK